ncbi:hypothetical protein UA08_02064 [Talaromyces atroroseus]|uniref:CRAL-TRIO domain-containing protein n=1 Tax=Talaromyces atroroseus TaxID=1441469 RepID=A0A1Q5QAY8_TALAT|nr:hypothetical protein UA08_02064 [Talaromyces atroroseus]OKL62978.1 hypothetical protein UA08_02064 [Talaromyces atroroseus]
MDPQTGVLGSLTADQEARLQQLWMFLLNAFESNSIYDNNLSTPTVPRRSNSLDEPPLSPASFNTSFSGSRLSMSSNTNIIPPSPTTPISPISPTTLSETQSQSHKPQHQRSLRKLRRRISLNNASEPVSSATPIPQRSSTHKRSLMFQTQSMGGIHLRPSPQNTKVMQRVMATYKIGPDELRQGLLRSLKQDHPDSMLLRFLRARKWNVGKAFVMLVSAIAWRTKKMHIDDDIVRRGELYAYQQSRSLKLDPREQRKAWDFMKQLRMGKNIIHGVDRAGRPIVNIRVRLHRAEDQADDVLERYVVHTIESVRMLLRPPLVETAILIFNMTDFSMANMDYTPVKFIIKCLENFYPESLARIIIHKAPWFFSGIWKMIKTWMNDSLVSRVFFTKNLSDLELYIPRQNIPSDLGGSEDKYQYHYIEPDADDLAENLPLETHSPTRNFLLNQHHRISEEFLETTRLWLQTSAMRDTIGTAVQQDRRAELIEELRINFWKLDPFVRARCQLDREGVIVSDGIGTINFYPHLRPVTSSSESFGTTSAGAAVTTSSGLLSPSSSVLSAAHDHDYKHDVDVVAETVGKPGAEQTTSSTTMNMVNFLLDDSDIDHDDGGDDNGYQARDDFMQEYMDDGAGHRNPSSDNTINDEMREWKFPEEEIPQHNHTIITTTNDYDDTASAEKDTNINNNNPLSDVETDTDTDTDMDTDLDDDDDEEIEIHDAVTQKITYPRAGGLVGRTAVRLVNVR